MTTIRVSSFEDVRDDEVLHSRARDAVIRELADGAEAVLYLEQWLIDQKSLDPIEDLGFLFSGRVISQTDKAYLFATADPDDLDEQRDGAGLDVTREGADWVPKSQSRVYRPPTGDDVDDATPQVGLDEFAR